MAKKQHVKQFQGEVVRRLFKNGAGSNKYYYIDKGTGKRVKESTWRDFKNLQHEKIDTKAAGIFDVATVTDEGNRLEFHVQSMPNTIRELLFNPKYKGKRVYVIDKDGKKHRLTKRNSYKLTLQEKQYIREQADYFKGNTAGMKPKDAKEVNDNAYRNVFYNVLIKGYTSENENNFYFDYGFMNFKI